MTASPPATPRWSLVQYRPAPAVAGGADTAEAVPTLGVEVDGEVRLAPGEMAHLTLLQVLDDWARWAPVLRALDVTALAPVAGPVVLAAPVTYPRKLLCAGANYYSHAAGMGTARPDPGASPFFFLKPPTTTVVGPHAAVAIRTTAGSSVDWEAEVGVVVADRCRDLADDEASAHVAGYLVANDISDRGAFIRPDAVFPPFGFDWLAHKGQDGFCPLGPGMVPVWQVPDPQDLRIRLTVNDVVKQDASTADMVVGVHRLLAAASRMVTLEPGDVILTGTPAGVGMPRREFLHPGDVVTVTVAGLGTLHNEIVAR